MRGGATLIALLLALAGPAVARGDQQPNGLPVDIRTVSAVSDLRADNGDRALAVYRALIPNGLDVPAHPAVGVWLSEISSGRAVDGRPMDDADHWIEGAIEIRVRRGSEEGWYPIHYPVTAEFWFHAGRAVGLPKRHTSSASITPQGAGWRAQATPRGTSGPGISMAWQPSNGADSEGVALAFRAATDPLFTLNSALKGPDLERVQYVISPPYPEQTLVPGGPPAYSPATAKPTPGLVQLRLRHDLDAVQEADLPKIFPAGSSLADLIDPDAVVPGAYYFYALTLTSDSRVIGQGGYSRQAGPLPQSHTKKSCKRRRSVKLSLHARRGTRLRRLHASTRKLRLHAAIVRRAHARHLRIRVDVSGLPRGRYRVRVSATTRRGRHLRASRVVRICR